MIPKDCSQLTFEDVKKYVDKARAVVHRAWLAHGPGTTRQISAASGIDLLTLRPRSTELYQLGLLQLLSVDGHDGRYQARTLEQWQEFHAAQRLPANQQLSLKV